MTSTVVPIDPKRGNTKPRSQKQISPAKKWVFTWNNYPDDWYSSIVPKFQNLGKFGLQPEVGQGGTRHIQGWVEFEAKVRPLSLGLPREIHWEKMRGTVDDSIAYCSKSLTKAGEYVTNWKKIISMEIEDEDIIPYDNLFLWGQDLVDMVKDCLPAPTDRRIFWYWSNAGQMKKTETARYLAYHHNAVVIQGGRKHVLAVTYKNPAPIYILTVPRTDEGYVSYSSLELIKDALYMSAFGTEATGMVNRKKPWIIVMANFPPEREKLSEDRWVVHNVDVNHMEDFEVDEGIMDYL